jgi:hypothetical protein
MFLNFVLFFAFSQNLLPYVPYQGISKQIKTDHFIVIFPKKYEQIARKTAAYSEEIHSYLSPYMKWKPFGRTQIVLTDNSDMPNGSAIPSPRNTILLYLAPAELEETLKSEEDPLYSIIVHEYSHILHLDQIREDAWFWRVINGRLYFPVSNSFTWYFEGVAVFNESKFSKGGRGNSNYTNALIRDAALHDAIPSFDKVVNPIVDWPNGKAAYHYGARFLEYIYSQYGKEKYDEVFINASREFWPFIFRFAMSFKKIYGKDLTELWNEWIAYEKNNAKSHVIQSDGIKLTDLEGEILAFNKKGDDLFISSYSYKNDKYLYRLSHDGKLKKLVNGYIRSVSGTGDENIILYTKSSPYPDDFEYFDVYSFNLKTKIEKKLTSMERINYISFANSGSRGIMAGYSGLGSKLILADFVNGKFTNKKEVSLPENIGFIDQPSMNDPGTEVVFSARLRSGAFKIYILNAESLQITEVKGIMGTEAKFTDDGKISYISHDENTDNLFLFDRITGENFKVLKSPNCVLHQKISGNKIYYVDETYMGEELFSEDLSEKSPYKFPDTDETSDKIVKSGIIKSDDLKVENYNFFRSLYPLIWAFLPYQIQNSYVILPLINGYYLPIPYVAPKFMIYNTTSLGRFSYTASIGFDYLRYYPDNSFSFKLKLPGFDINYSWENHAGGQELFYVDATDPGNNSILYYQRYNGRAPVVFSNYFSLNSTLPLAGYGNLVLQASFTHQFDEYDFTMHRLTNTFSFYQRIGYYFSVSRIKASRWDRGISLNFAAYQSPGNLLDNSPLYLIRGSVEGRVPFYNTFAFIQIEGGKELLSQNAFSANTSILNYSENLLGTGNSTSINNIDTKAFPVAFARSSTGSAFISTDSGFDISLYKRSHYWHFATLGFKEVYIRAYNEFVYLYNFDLSPEFYKGILFDGVFELGVDLFVAYGNMTVGLLVGGAIGYRVGDDVPAWGIFVSVNFSLGY